MPLAETLRPKSFDEVIGQHHLLSKGKPLEVMVSTSSIKSMLLWGPPGVGKTTLARLIAKSSNAVFEQLSAVNATVKDIREVVDKAKKRMEPQLIGMKQTVLFLDEIHRFSKSQQDSLLPVTEDGTIVLIGATTENPYHSIIPPLRSRMLLFTLYPLDKEDIVELINRASKHLKLKIADDAVKKLITLSEGDARRLLTMLDAISGYLPIGQEITVQTLIDSEISRIYKGGDDEHFDLLSAFIKSMRGSDEKAALYYLARLIENGEDPRLIVRRMIVFASEDIGLADSSNSVLSLIVSVSEAVEKVGLPEARINLYHGVVALCRAKKSNEVYVLGDKILNWVKENPTAEVPKHLRDSSYKSAKKLGHGVGYKYPHNYENAIVEQQYLPNEVDLENI